MAWYDNWHAVKWYSNWRLCERFVSDFQSEVEYQKQTNKIWFLIFEKTQAILWFFDTNYVIL